MGEQKLSQFGGGVRTPVQWVSHLTFGGGPGCGKRGNLELLKKLWNHVKGNHVLWSKMRYLRVYDANLGWRSQILP